MYRMGIFITLFISLLISKLFRTKNCLGGEGGGGLQRSLDFQGPPLPIDFEMGFARIKIIMPRAE
jgi:hypothetical protein